MKLANIAFHMDTPGRFSVLKKHLRKTNLKEKVENLFDENKGKRSILRRYLSDAVRQLNYVEIDEVSDISEVDYDVDTMDCAFQESATISVNVSEKHFNPRTCMDMGYIQGKDEFSNSSFSSSSTLVNDDMDIDLVRVPGDGTEEPDSTDDKFTGIECGRSERVVIGVEQHNLINCRSLDKQTPSTRAASNGYVVLKDERREIKSEKAINKEVDQLVSKSEKVLDCKPMYCECNALSETRKTIKHKPTGKLKGLLKLYKTMKLRKKFVKKCIADNITCFTPVKSRTCLNSAFITDQTRIDGSLSVSGNTRLNLTSVDSNRLNSGILGETTEYNRIDSACINTTDSTSNVLNAAFISSDLTDSKNAYTFTEGETFMQKEITVTNISDQTGDELNFAKIHSQFLPLYEDMNNCTSTFEEFAYFNNGFVMD
jgi:hypothetical protein